MSRVDVAMPDYAQYLLYELRVRYYVLYGGRGSSKSYTIARILLSMGRQRKIRVLCAREFQNSISESVHRLLCEQIDALGFTGFYSYTNNTISGANGTEFIFKGVRMNVASIKSMVGLTHLWIEEAHTISQHSWDVLIPTIREPNSEIWVSFNPENDDDPTYKMFVDKNNNPLDRDDAVILKVNYIDNPWFPNVLKQEKDYLYRVNPDLACHVWGGECRRNSDIQIFKNKWTVQAFEPNSNWAGPYFGADFGFSVDPSTLVKCYIDTVNRIIYIRYAIFGYHTEIDYLADLYDRVPESRNFTIRGDSSRPETISFVSRKGFSLIPADKWEGSVEDGIEWLRNWNQIIIHPDCHEMINEAKNYSYKTDRLTGDILTDVVDAYNHGWDAIRYAFQPLISGGGSILDIL